VTDPNEPDPAIVPPDPLWAAVNDLVRGEWTEFESCLVAHGAPALIRSTRTVLRCHFVRSDPNGRPRVDALAGQLAKQIVHFCIPRSQILRAQQLPPNKMVEEVSRLHLHAQRLFTRSQPNTGEGGELLLYALLERHLGIPQILSKMSLKTSTEVQIHGTDGVHAHFLQDGRLALYWGEAKIYNDLDAALTSCFSSIGPYLRGEATAQDLFLIEHYADTGDEQITQRLIEYFDNDSPKAADVVVRAACLVGFPSDQYPELPARAGELGAELDAQLTSWEDKLDKKICGEGLADFHVELFLIPVPSAAGFRAAVKTALGLPT
jgi:Cap4 SAVED domain